jgi:hypothetical protein
MKTGYKRETRMTTGQTFICGAISGKYRDEYGKTKFYEVQ